MNRTSAPIIAAATASLVGFAPASLYAQASSTEKPVLAENSPEAESRMPAGHCSRCCGR